MWVNCTNVFDAASGFGGYRESGFGREGGAEGMYEYLRPSWEQNLPETTEPEFVPRAEPGMNAENAGNGEMVTIDRTPKLYIGGKQARPDSGYSYPVFDPAGKHRGGGLR